MSKGAIRQALDLLQELPDSDQEIVLEFLKGLKNRAATIGDSSPAGSFSALQNVDGLLVFTGEIGDRQTDWLRLIREERDQQILGVVG